MQITLFSLADFKYKYWSIAFIGYHICKCYNLIEEVAQFDQVDNKQAYRVKFHSGQFDWEIFYWFGCISNNRRCFEIRRCDWSIHVESSTAAMMDCRNNLWELLLHVVTNSVSNHIQTRCGLKQQSRFWTGIDKNTLLKLSYVSL